MVEPPQQLTAATGFGFGAQQLVGCFDLSNGSACMSSDFIASMMGVSEDKVCPTNSVRLLRSKSNDEMPFKAFSFCLIKRSSVRQSIASIFNAIWRTCGLVSFTGLNTADFKPHSGEVAVELQQLS
nr:MULTISPECIES: hypothetical protein [Pseudomonas]